MTVSSQSTTHYGAEGAVQVANALVAKATQWQATETVGESAWGDADSGLFTNRLPTRKNLAGNIQGKLKNTSKQYNVLSVGDYVELVLWEDGLDGSPGDYWYVGCALITSFDYLYNMDTKEVVGWTANWAADGQYYRPGEAGAPAVTFNG